MIRRLAAWLFVVTAIVPTVAPAARHDAGQAKPPQAQKPQKPPSTKLIEPWPDEAKMAERKADAVSRRLFRQSEPLVLTLAADFKAVNRDRDRQSTKTYPAKVTVGGQGGKESKAPLAVTLRTRGNVRLSPRICSFVPLSIDFQKKQTKGTEFDGLNRLKLVTHCQDNTQYEQYVLREYLAYRLHNLITPWAFRVRLARVTYVDSTTGKPLTTRHAILIEDEDDLAARMEGRPLALPRMEFKDFDQNALTVLMLFQYMIGNTDFSIYALHNVHMVQTRAKAFYPIAWDFDATGLVDAPYGVPDKQLGIIWIGDRLYRGPCRTMAEFEPSLAIFRAKQAEAMALFNLPGLDERNRREATAYLGEFFTLLGRPDTLKRNLADGCRNQPTM